MELEPKCANEASDEYKCWACDENVGLYWDSHTRGPWRCYKHPLPSHLIGTGSNIKQLPKPEGIQDGNFTEIALKVKERFEKEKNELDENKVRRLIEFMKFHNTMVQVDYSPTLADNYIARALLRQAVKQNPQYCRDIPELESMLNSPTPGSMCQEIEASLNGDESE